MDNVLKNFNFVTDESNSRNSRQTLQQHRLAIQKEMSDPPQHISSDAKENVITTIGGVNQSGNKSVSLNDILGGSKIVQPKANIASGDNVTITHVEQNLSVRDKVLFDRGEQLTGHVECQAPIDVESRELNVLSQKNVSNVVEQIKRESEIEMLGQRNASPENIEMVQPNILLVTNPLLNPEDGQNQSAVHMSKSVICINPVEPAVDQKNLISVIQPNLISSELYSSTIPVDSKTVKESINKEKQKSSSVTIENVPDKLIQIEANNDPGLDIIPQISHDQITSVPNNTLSASGLEENHSLLDGNDNYLQSEVSAATKLDSIDVVPISLSQQAFNKINRQEPRSQTLLNISSQVNDMQIDDSVVSQSKPVMQQIPQIVSKSVSQLEPTNSSDIIQNSKMIESSLEIKSEQNPKMDSVTGNSAVLNNLPILELDKDSTDMTCDRQISSLSNSFQYEQTTADPKQCVNTPESMILGTDVGPSISVENPLASIKESHVTTPIKLEDVKKNLLTMFDTVETGEMTRDEIVPALKQQLQTSEEPKSIQASTSTAIDKIKNDESFIKLRPETNVTTTTTLSAPHPTELQILNSEIQSNNEQINSALESVILNQILEHEHSSDVIPNLVEQTNNHTDGDGASSAQNGNKLENMILNQILEQNNFRASIDEIPDSKFVETQNPPDFQVSDIDITSADQFIEFVDEIIDFALRKVDFLRSSEPEKPHPLTPVPEAEETEENPDKGELNEYYDHCMFTPTLERQLSFPTLESFEIEELQAKAMEQADALYLNETPINESLPLLPSVPQSPKVNELQAKAMEQAHALNLNETIADFVYLHSAESKLNSQLSAQTPAVEVKGIAEPQRKIPPPIAISAVIANSAVISPAPETFSKSPSPNFSESMETSLTTEPFFLGDSPPAMSKSQSNRPQSPLDTSQTKLSQSMNEVYFDKRLNLTAKRNSRRDRDQKMQKMKKDFFNENLNRDKSQEKTPSRDTPRDSLEDLSEVNTNMETCDDTNNRQEDIVQSEIAIPSVTEDKSEVVDSDKSETNKDIGTDKEESLKDSLENIVDAVEKECDKSSEKGTAEVHDSIRDSLENLVEAVEAISESVKENETVLQKKTDNQKNSVEAKENQAKKCNCNCAEKTTTSTSHDIIPPPSPPKTTAVDELQQQNACAEIEVKSSSSSSTPENVNQNFATAPSIVEVQAANTLPVQVITNAGAKNSRAERNVTMSLDINGGDKLNSNNKYYESVNSDETKIRKDFIMAEYRKPVMGTTNGEFDKIIDEYESKEESLIRRLTEKEKTITKMTGVMEAYEKTIAEMIAEKEQLIQEYETKCVSLKNDADLNAQHLLSLEDTFADLHAKYERSKQVTISLKMNEEELRKDNMKNLELLGAQETRYEKMKSHAIGQLQIANEKLEMLTRAHAHEIAKVKALLKREELARSSLTEQLQQKVRENEELVKICEELIGKE